MTPAELRTEITTGPLAAELAAAWAASRDSEVAGTLNRQDRPGYVPARSMVAELAKRNLWGLVMYGARHRMLPNGAACPFSLFTLFASCELAGFGTIDPPIRMEVGPLTAGLSAMISTGLISTADRDAILSYEVKISRAEELLGYEKTISAEEVEYCRIRISEGEVE